MINLLGETLQELAKHNKTPKDVISVIAFPLRTDWKHFELKANFEYDNGYGCNEINLNLKIIGDGWWLEREEYDGSEWWSFKELEGANEFRDALPREIIKMIKNEI